MVESMRLLCLLSLTENGLLPKDYRSLKAQFLQSYGIEHLLTFSNLKQLGLLVEQQPGETLTVMESRVGKLVNDKTAGQIQAGPNTVTVFNTGWPQYRYCI
nr:vacuolar protein sorting-associated protein 33B-like [Oncorhynchus nerka]